MMAIDGVAPLAKMAQQRTRRFMAAHLEAQRKSLEATVRDAVQHIGVAGGSRLVWQGACDMLCAQLPFKLAVNCTGACSMVRQ